MPQNAMDNPLVLPMLGLLAESPRQQYALFAELRDRYAFLRVKTSTVYTLVGSLERNGLAALDGEQEVSLTREGIAELRRRVEAHLREADPNADPKFAIALAYLGILPPGDAAALLRERAQALKADARAADEVLRESGVAELHMIEGHFLASRLRHDATWLNRLAGRIESGDLAWP
ncbi:hypothetical protein FPZ12_021980 [Amycolatopsis acidicola]|uniref:Uncharacterized protein n=1 Tax=Amycolatopsis acidicola TaxID=2596893 RepID=A0A5N0V1Q9_9PSEU|nr:helix-turn-helix transcriptional regulator [Amycolatopsis acidicola]KAA9158733.1 hypothetical protein FPZ12_021980 [Amycolatopsis acidicola]